MKYYQYRCNVCGYKAWYDWLMSWTVDKCPMRDCNGTMSYTGRSGTNPNED